MSWPATGLVVIVGPTAAGKSGLAEALAQRYDAELVSADALQVYRGLDIGTAKPPAEVRAAVRYHGLDLYDPADRCSAGRFGRWARQTLEEIRSRRHRAILVGGSGFYVRAVLEPLDAMPPSDPRWRRALSALSEDRGVAELHRWLLRLDPGRAGRIDPADRQRLLRALEVVLRTGQRAADRPTAPHVGAPVPHATIGLRWERGALVRRIEERVDRMLAAGWNTEVGDLLAAGIPEQAHGLQAIGYRELLAHRRGEATLEETRAAIVLATRRYAKRQMTWLRRHGDAAWIDLPRRGGLDALVAEAERLIASAGGHVTQAPGP